MLSQKSTPTKEAIALTLKELAVKFKQKRSDHLGYPYNLDFDSGAFSQFSKFLINNLGDPYVGSHYATEVCALERDVIAWVEKLWGG